MKSIFEFTIVASGLNPDDKDFLDRFFTAGCDDASISFQKGVILLEFEREAASFPKALLSAVMDVFSAGAKIERVEPDYLVSLSDIAKRTGYTRAAVSLWSSGKRHEGFPPPVARVTSDTPLWDWVTVARWLQQRQHLSADEVTRAVFVKEANLAIRAHELPHDKFVKKIEDRIAEIA